MKSKKKKVKGPRFTKSKVSNREIDLKFLKKRADLQLSNKYPVAKWIQFCEYFIKRQYRVFLYEAKQTVSKYVTLEKNEKFFKVRFSNHKPIKEKQINKDCDFFVGITHEKTTTTRDAALAVLAYFGETPGIK